MTIDASLLWAAAVTATLMAAHGTARRLNRLAHPAAVALGSLGGGLSVSYVFLHLLPELAEGNEDVGRALEDVVRPTPLTELAIFLVAVVGFVLFYGLERAAGRVGPDRADDGPDDIDGPDGDPDGATVGVYRLHLGAYALYNGLITYTMPLRARTGIGFAWAFALAMALHFVLNDRGLAERYGSRFDRRSGWILMAALALGWLAAVVAAPVSTTTVTVLIAFLAGSVLWNVFSQEIPETRSGSFAWFVAGAAGYAALLAWLTGLER